MTIKEVVDRASVVKKIVNDVWLSISTLLSIIDKELEIIDLYRFLPICLENFCCFYQFRLWSRSHYLFINKMR